MMKDKIKEYARSQGYKVDEAWIVETICALR
jgi:hypothetical protein